MSKQSGDSASFNKNWASCEEALYTHWVRGAVANQVQFAFRQHWQLFQELLSQEKEYNGGKDVLEVGCGRGSLSCYFADAGFTCSLLDSSQTVIDLAEKTFEKYDLNARFIVGDAVNMPLPDASYDIVFSIGLLEHFEHIEAPIQEQLRVLRKGGMWFGYIVPEKNAGVQEEAAWIQEILSSYAEAGSNTTQAKEEVYRSAYGSDVYIPVLRGCGLRNIRSSGVYSVPMISHSPSFPFSLMPHKAEQAFVDHFTQVFEQRKKQTGLNPWLCDESYGNAFLVWGVK